MTFSLLAYDAPSHSWGGVAATGNLCVGGWVLRGRADVGISASQGQSPSTLWGEAVLDRLGDGMSAQSAVDATVGADPGRDHRQLSALGQSGSAGAYTGPENGSVRDHLIDGDVIASGNILANDGVLPAMIDAYRKHPGGFEERLMFALNAGHQAGGDRRGIRSAALLIVSPSRPPLSLRIDSHDAPTEALQSLCEEVGSDAYQRWLSTVPTLQHPERHPETDDALSLIHL